MTTVMVLEYTAAICGGLMIALLYGLWSYDRNEVKRQQREDREVVEEFIRSTLGVRR